MGINACRAPQSSEHCPKYTPGFVIVSDFSFKRPGTASSLNQSDGTAKAWITSAAVV
jgi:hypothetical protein